MLPACLCHARLIAPAWQVGSAGGGAGHSGGHRRRHVGIPAALEGGRVVVAQHCQPDGVCGEERVPDLQEGEGGGAHQQLATGVRQRRRERALWGVFPAPLCPFPCHVRYNNWACDSRHFM